MRLIKENKFATCLFVALVLFIIGFGVFKTYHRPAPKTIRIEYQDGTIDTVSIPIYTAELEKSCIVDGFDGKTFVCGVRKFEILK